MTIEESNDYTDAGDARREQILRAALDVIGERGFSETRIADVAERAEVSPALVIYYFKTKARLLTDAMRLAEDLWYEAGGRRMAAMGTARDRLEELVAMTCLPDPEPSSAPAGAAGGTDAAGAGAAGAGAAGAGAAGAGAAGAGDAASGIGATEPWSVWLDLWAQAARHEEVGRVREEFDEHWRATIRSIVREGQGSGEFRQVDVDYFAIVFAALLDGLAVQIALDDSVVDAWRAFEVSMRLASELLGFEWSASLARRGS